MIRKEIFIGLIFGLLSNTIGASICTLIVSKMKGLGFVSTFNLYSETGNLWMIITLGALPNLAVFFWVLRQNLEYRARGVLLATFVTAITAYLIYFL